MDRALLVENAVSTVKTIKYWCRQAVSASGDCPPAGSA
jgi:hypothetical protein